MPKRKTKLTDQDERELEELDEIYGKKLVYCLTEACAGLTRTKHHTFKYISHELCIDIYDEFFIAVNLKVDTLEDTINIPFYIIDDFNYENDRVVDGRVLKLDIEAKLDKTSYLLGSDERRLLRIAYLIGWEVRSGL